jgi:hypothetical protein
MILGANLRQFDDNKSKGESSVVSQFEKKEPKYVIEQIEIHT